MLALVALAAPPAFAQSASVDLQSGVTTKSAAPKQPAVLPPAIAAAIPAPPASTPVVNAGPTTLLLRGLDKITGRPTDIAAPLGHPVQFATLTITARFCYSTPASETPETAAFVQIEDHRPDQTARRIFSGWMYGSSPGLNAVEHPLYDVWVITCRGGASGASAPPTATTSTAPVKVQAPDSSDKEGVEALPEGAGQ
jgi:hypothetical protein